MSLLRFAVPSPAEEFILLRQRVRDSMEIRRPILTDEEMAERMRVFEAAQKRIREAKNGRRTPIGRNELCWCGSEKKFKKCHYPNQ